MSELAESAAKRVQEKFAGKVGRLKEFRGEYTLELDREIIVEAAKFLRDELEFDYLVDLSGIDNFGEEPRFEVVYEFARMVEGVHLRLKIMVSEEEPSAPSIMKIFPTADWHEREAYDMFGIKFDGHPDLRRILMWEGYPYHPLRKDFPLEGKPSELPGEAFSEVAPLEGGPFVSAPQQGGLRHKSEPRSREPVE